MLNIEKMVWQLSPELRREAIDFVRFLLQKQKPKAKKPLRLSWAGALKQYRKQYTSLQLQRKALEWWGD